MKSLSYRWATFTAALIVALAVSPRYVGSRQEKDPHTARLATTHEVPRNRPKLIVLIVVDQMRADYVDKFKDHWTGGFRRLIETGAWLRNAAYPYAETETCVGHATISTGAFPSTHGIISNSWWDRASQTSVACTDDAAVKDVGYGASTKGGDTAARLLIPSFANELKFQRGGKPRLFTFSLKARAAIMLAGAKADGATWFDATAGVWETSSAYPLLPFVREYAKKHPPSEDFGKVWTPLFPLTSYLYDERARGSVPPPGWGQQFPHALKGHDGSGPDADYYRQWEASPFPDTDLVKLAEAAIDSAHLGNGSDTDYLTISFSSPDYVAHAFGPRSREIQDELSRLDLNLGELFSFLDRKVGSGNYLIALTGDHGGTPIPEDMQSMGVDAGWLSLAEVKEQAESALQSFQYPSPTVADVDDADVYFTPGTFDKLQHDPTAMRAVLAAIKRVPGVAAVYRAEELDHRPTTDDPILRSEAASFLSGRSGDLLIVPKPYWSWDFTPKGSRRTIGDMHGTPYEYDQRVPIFFMGFGIRAGTDYTLATPADIAPTLATLSGVTLSSRDGHVLSKILRK